jgi:hypothetical protein
MTLLHSFEMLVLGLFSQLAFMSVHKYYKSEKEPIWAEGVEPT